MSLLEPHFADLPFAANADRWLASLNGRPLLIQFAERKIGTIKIVTSMINVDRLALREDNMFVISLSSFNTSAQDAEELGCALGQTFHYDLTKPRPFNLLSLEAFNAGRDKRVRDFCQAFSEHWLEINNKVEVIRSCKFERITLLSTETFSPHRKGYSIFRRYSR